MKKPPHPLSRRAFVRRTAAAAAGLNLLPGHARSQSPNDKLNLACIGVGGRGAANVNGVSGENIIALCDVDSRRAADTAGKHPKAKLFRDFRRMFDALGDSIDAVTVATPDHTHAVACLAAIERGIHVYCEKPLAHSIHEIRTLMKAAREHNVVTQLGNQGHSFDHIRTFCEWIWDGAIGEVHTIHAGCGSDYSKIDQLPLLAESHPVPEGLDWDLWLGPVEFRPYHPVYLPGKWRGWMPFGSGTVGDWVCHVVDPVFWALDLGAPISVKAQADGYDPKLHADTFPSGTTIEYLFPANKKRGPVKLVWFDGNHPIPRPDELEPGRKVPSIGAIVYGTRGNILYGSHGATGVRLFPEERMKAYQRPDQSLPRVRGHHQDWLDAIRGGKQAGSNFAYGGPLTELAQLGIVATKLLGQKLEWDGPAMRFTNSEDANRWIHRPARDGWKI